MSMSLRIANLLLIVTAVAGCSRETVPATQVIVSIDAEPNVRARTATLQIQVRGLPAVAPDVWDSDETLDADLDQLLLPYSLSLVPKNGDATREYEVLVTARTAESATGGLARYVSVSRTLSGYRANRRLLLEVMLTDDCIGTIACEPEATCKAAQCASASVDPAALPEFSASMVPDASVSKPDDASVQLPPISDAGEDAAVDPGCPNGQCLCREGSTISCGAERGECDLGTQTCVNNLWGPCMGQTSAAAETCNKKDDDCDGNFDEDSQCNALDLPQTFQAVCDLARGVCVPAASGCQLYYGDCDPEMPGCEQLLNTTDHCGACGAVCETLNGTPTCETGVCEVDECDLDFDDCDDNPRDCETSLHSDEHCGACNAACTAHDNAVTECDEVIGAPACEITSCDDGFADCDLDVANGCESELDSDAHNCGVCGNDCAAKGNLKRGVCVASQCSFDCQDNFADCDGLESNGCEHDLGDGPCDRCFQRTSNIIFYGGGYNFPTDVAFCAGTHIFDPATGWDTPCCGACPDVSGPVQLDDWTDLVYILQAKSLTVPVGATIKLIGAYPVIIAVEGDATIAGTIDAGAVGSLPGAGGSTSPGCVSPGGSGQDGPITGGIVRGGGGGGFGTPGGLGGGMISTTGGKTHGQPNLVPLRGGCSGGRGGRPAPCAADTIPAAGAGGGAFQLSVAGKLTITVDGRLLANGGLGTDALSCPGSPANYIAASGGGSGGAILLEASAFSMPPLGLEAVADVDGARGGSNGGAGATSSSTNGANGASATPNPGGGGGYGRVFMRSCVGP